MSTDKPRRSRAAANAIGRYAAYKRHHGPNDPRVAQALNDAQFATALDQVRRAVEAASTLTEEQRLKVAQVVLATTR